MLEIVWAESEGVPEMESAESKNLNDAIDIAISRMKENPALKYVEINDENCVMLFNASKP